jgi:RHS repeat-associated protein
MKAGVGAAAATYFIHSNALYSPQAVTDQDGQVVERYSYTAYGERTVLGGYSGRASRIGFNFGFTGLRDEGGLLFARNRYFSPELGRWTSRDPAGYVDGYSL